MSNFSFGVGIESLIRFDNKHPVISARTRDVTASALNINFISHDPIKNIFSLNQTIENQLLLRMRPKQYIEQSLINYRVYNRVLGQLNKKVRSRQKFKSDKHESLWKRGLSQISLLEKLQSEVSSVIASDVQV